MSFRILDHTNSFEDIKQTFVELGNFIMTENALLVVFKTI